MRSGDCGAVALFEMPHFCGFPHFHYYGKAGLCVLPGSWVVILVIEPFPSLEGMWVCGSDSAARHSCSSSAVRRLMNSVTSTTIFFSVLLHAVLKRRCRLAGKSMLRRRVGSSP